MQVINFEFNGPREFVTCDGHLSKLCAEDIISCRSYPLPAWECDPKMIVDVGGHCGEFSMMAKLRWPDAEVHCYEPNPELGNYLAENALRYHFHVHPVAIGGRRGLDKVPLFRSGYGSVANSLVYRPNQVGVAAEVTMLGPEEIEELRPDVLKLDCEGVEFLILRKLDVSRIALIYLEFHTADDRWKIDDLLRPTHDVWHAKIGHKEQGEMMYILKGYVP